MADLELQQQNLNTRLIIQADYEDLKTNQEKVKHLEKVNKKIFNWKIIDLLKTNNEFLSVFLKEKHEFGGGYGEITSGIADIFEYTINPEERFPEERYLLKDYKDSIDKLVQSVVILTYNETDLKQYFSTFENYTKWIQLNYKRIKDSINLNIFLFLKKVFTLKNEDADTEYNFLKNVNFSESPLFKIVKEIQDKIKKAKTIKIATDKTIDLFKKIIEVYREMVSEPTDQFHLDTTIKGFPIQVDPSQLVLILSNADKTEFENEVKTEKFHPEFLKLPEISTFYLNLPKGKAILIDKRALQISPFFEGTYTSFYPKTLDTDIFSHFQYRVGVFGLYPCVIFHNNLGEI